MASHRAGSSGKNSAVLSRLSLGGWTSLPFLFWKDTTEGRTGLLGAEDKPGGLLSCRPGSAPLSAEKRGAGKKAGSSAPSCASLLLLGIGKGKKLFFCLFYQRGACQSRTCGTAWLLPHSSERC